MSETIKSGTGKGYLASVNEGHRLLTSSISVGLRTHVSAVHGQAYTASTGSLTLSAADTWHWAYYFKNTSTTHNLHINFFEVTWNGGSTNYNRPLEMRNFIPLNGDPTGNYTTVTAGQNNHNSGNVAGMEIFKWDNVGAGMTDSSGPGGGNRFFTQGRSIIDFSGAVIMKFNDFVGMQFRSVEVGSFSFGISVFFIDKEATI